METKMNNEESEAQETTAKPVKAPSRIWGIFLILWSLVLLLLGLVYGMEFISKFSLMSLESKDGILVIGKGVLTFACLYFAWRSVTGGSRRVLGKQGA